MYLNDLKDVGGFMINKIKKKDNYNFVYKTEYKNYKAIGSKNGKYRNYLEWEQSIREKYKNVTIDTLNNFIHFLNKKQRNSEFIKTCFISFTFPFFILLISMLLSFIPTLNNIEQDIIQINENVSKFICETKLDTHKLSSTEIRNMKIQDFKDTEMETLNWKIESIKSLKRDFLLIDLLCLVVVLIFVIRAGKAHNDIYFYLDYKNIIIENLKLRTLKKGSN